MEQEKRLRELLREFRSKYPMTIGWRFEQNSKIVLKHLYDDEEILYAFYAQKNDNPFNILGTGVIVLTNKRLVIGRDRVVVGYFFDSITPDMFSDLKVKSGVIFGKVEIDMLHEFIILSNIDKRALPEIEKKVSSFMHDVKRKICVDNQENVC